MMSGPEEHKQRVAELFNQVADGYGSPALRFFPFVADHMIYRLRPKPGSKILDVATGHGAVAIAAAQMVGPQGRVHAIDMATNMLDWVRRHAEKMKLENIDLHEMDAERLEFRDRYFDAVICSFGLFFLPDMEAALRSWLRVTRPGGTLMFSSFAHGLMEPMADMFRRRMEAHGVTLELEAWHRLKEAEEIEALLQRAGAVEIEVTGHQSGFHLNDANDWWEVLWNSGYRGLLQQLDAEQLAQFRQEHLAEVAELQDDKGIWMEIPVYVTTARRPAAD